MMKYYKAHIVRTSGSLKNNCSELTRAKTAGSGVCLLMWIMDKTAGRCPSRDATKNVLGKKKADV